MTLVRSAQCSSRPDAGFTLLELLVAMTLLGLLMTVLFGGLRFGARAWERGMEHSRGTDEIRLAQMHIRRGLELAYPYFISDLERPRIDFDGTSERVRFLALAANSQSPGGRARIILSSSQQDGALALLIEARPELALPEIPFESDVLVSGFKTLEFSYYGSSGRDDPPEWLDRWIDRTRLPLLVRVRAEFAEDDGRFWPELVVAPRLSADVGCIYDVLTNYCRGR
jgi:general secretion pathway protein J